MTSHHYNNHQTNLILNVDEERIDLYPIIYFMDNSVILLKMIWLQWNISKTFSLKKLCLWLLSRLTSTAHKKIVNASMLMLMRCSSSLECAYIWVLPMHLHIHYTGDKTSDVLQQPILSPSNSLHVVNNSAYN